MTWQPPTEGDLPAGWERSSTERDGVPRWVWVVVAVFALLVVGAVSSRSGSDGDDLHPSYRDAIDGLRRDGDCVTLQFWFDRADEVDELTYIDDALKRAGCYD